MATKKDMFGNTVDYNWKSSGKKFTAKELMEYDIMDAVRSPTAERANVAEQMRRLTLRRLATHFKNGEYSYAVDRLLSQMGEMRDLHGNILTQAPTDGTPFYGRASYGMTTHSTNTRDFTLNDAVQVWNNAKHQWEMGDVFQKYEQPHNAIISEISILQDFITAQTSTVTGNRLRNRRWDASIFGTDKRGRPLYRMSESERQKFWRVYAELDADYGNLIRGIASPKDADRAPPDESLTMVWRERDYANKSFYEIIEDYTNMRNSRGIRSVPWSERYEQYKEEKGFFGNQSNGGIDDTGNSID